MLQEQGGSAPGELASPQLPAECDDLGCSQRIKLETRRSLVTCDEAVPALPVAGKLPRPCRHHHKNAVRQQAAQAEQQGACRQRIRPVQIVNQQQRELARPPQRVEDRQQFGPHRQRVQALGQLAAQQRRRGHSQAPGGRGNLGDDAVTQVGLAFFPARPQYGGTANRRHELGEQAGLAHPRVALDEHHLRLVGARLGRQFCKHGQLPLHARRKPGWPC